MQFAIEPISQWWDEFHVLARDHWNETEGHHRGQTYLPLRERYEQYERAGWFFMFVARAEGRMVGFSGMYCVPSMHSQTVIATEDTWYLVPEYRGRGRTIIRFYQFIEDEMRRLGAIEINMSVPIVGPASRLLEWLDYQPVKIHYSKQLHPVRADSPQAGTPLTVGETPYVRTLATSRP